MKVDSEQNKLTIVRLGGPYDQTNGRVAPFALDNFDASMGIHNVSKIVGAHMKRDFHKTMDSIWVALVDASTTVANGNVVYPEGMAADNDAVAKGQFTLSYEQINRTSQQMDDANLPTLPDGKRMLVVTPSGEKQMKDDPQYARYATFFKEVNPLFPGWFGTSPEFHLFKSTTLTKPSNSSSVKIHYGHALAPSVFMGGIGEKVRVAASSDDNYGETAKLIWLAYLAMGIADYRFAYGVRYTENAQ